MECNVIKDLLPLYIDNCCSEESTKLVEEHLAKCTDCKSIYESMQELPVIDTMIDKVPAKMKRINDWKASIMQSLLLFVSFAIITVGVALEADMPSGFLNGIWAFGLVVPTTGFLLSLANWYFVRLYKNRKTFSTVSCLITLGITICAYIWTGFHYEISVFDIAKLISEVGFENTFEIVPYLTLLTGNGIVLTAIFCILSKALSNKYAVMLGKE